MSQLAEKIFIEDEDLTTIASLEPFPVISAQERVINKINSRKNQSTNSGE